MLQIASQSSFTARNIVREAGAIFDDFPQLMVK
jgi:hypothetical protein